MTEGHAPLDAFGIAWRLSVTLFFVALNGFFVAAEFALVKVRESRIAQRVREGARGAATVQHILQHLDRYLSACQLGITLASLVLGALGEPAVSVLLLAAARAAGLPVEEGSGWVSVVSIGLAFAVITTLHMTVGEQAPKIWALRRSEGTALATGPTLRAFTFLFGPFISGLHRLSNLLLRMVGLPLDHGHDEVLEAEEIRSALALSAGAGKISEQQLTIGENVLRLIDLEVRHIVVPRIEVEFVSLEHGVDESLAQLRASGHSRYPICERGLDSVVGMIHAKDVLDATIRGEAPDLRALAREPVFVADTMPLYGFLRELQQARQHCAVVLDERGTAIGLAFREDALEEIVGPLGDEFDVEETRWVEQPDGSVEVHGAVALPEVDDRLELELPAEARADEDTIGGCVTARLGRLARRGDRLRIGRFDVTVLDASRHRVQRLRLSPRPAPPEAPPDTAPE